MNRNSCSIIGMSVRFPGKTTKSEFWNALLDGGCFTGGMSEDRQRFHARNQFRSWGDIEKVKGMFLDDIDCFDRKLFGLSNPALIFSDPRQRLLLESCYAAIEDAGIRVSELQGKNVGVFVTQDGFDWSSYFHNIDQRDIDAQEFIIPGTISSFLASRIANVFDFHGPSMVVDGTCSSIYMAIHHARKSLQNGECDYALVGGATLFIEPWKDGELTPTSFESGVSEIKSFSNDADGYCSSEGGGAILLKASDEHSIPANAYATINASGYNAGGKTRSFAQPNQEQQELLYQALLNESGLSGEDISYIESHGIGAMIGDAIEGNSFINVFGRDGREPCYVSTIKPNIGHAQASSGLYSVFKALMAFKYEQIPGILGLNSSELNKEIAEDHKGLKFIDQAASWPKSELKQRQALLCTYGASNVNAALILQEARSDSKPSQQDNPGSVLICLSAQTEVQLETQKINLAKFIDDSDEQSFNLSDLAYTLQVGREQMEYRFATVVESADELVDALTNEQNGSPKFQGGHKPVKGLAQDENEFEGVEELFKNSSGLKALAKIWVKGENLNWRACYKNTDFKRLHLPVYPFAKDSYWLPEIQTKTASVADREQLHPLVQRNSSVLGEQRFSTTFTGDEFFLNDHNVRSHKVLPGVAYLEMLRKAGELATEGKITRFHNLTWLNQIKVGDTPKTIHISLFDDDGRVGYEVYSYEEREDELVELIHGQGQLSADTPDKPRNKNIDEIKGRLSKEWSKKECYDFYRRVGLDLGESYCGIESLSLGETESLSKINLTVDETFEWQLGLLDSTFQTGDLITLKEEEGLRLPFVLKEVIVYGDVKNTAWAHANVVTDDSDGTVHSSHDIDMLSAEGEVLLSMKGFVTIPLDGFKNMAKAEPATSLEPLDASDENLLEFVKAEILKATANILRLETSDLTTDEELGDYGFDSIMMTRLADDLNEIFLLSLMPTIFYSYPSIDTLSAFIIAKYKDNLLEIYNGGTGSFTADNAGDTDNFTSVTANEKSVSKRRKRSSLTTHEAQINPVSLDRGAKHEPVAIIGMSGRFPQSRNLDEFWSNLVGNKDLITEVPESRWDWRDYYGDPLEENGKTRSKWAGFIDHVDAFDPAFFGISQREADLMDPQQRIALECVYSAFENAAVPISSLKGESVGVYFGVSSFDYTSLLSQNLDLYSQAQFSTGSAHSVLANRISYLFDFTGPSEPINTACSSSLIAVHRAIESIASGDCELAVAGGVNAILSPELTLSFSKAGMLSDDGRCKTFDAAANGYVRGEGVGAVVLKPLAKALQDGDIIHAVIKGSAVNHGGKANTLTSPNAIAQADLLTKAYQRAGVDPRQVGYIEAHGTGTKLGDPIEVEGLKLAFEKLYSDSGLDPASDEHLKLGSVKTNIGHLEAAAGVAGLIKAVLSLQHQVIPGNPHLKNSNPYLQLDNSAFSVQRETTPWEAYGETNRVAGVSSFGFGGSNAHVVVEEFNEDKELASAQDFASSATILVSAKTQDSLEQSLKNLVEFLNGNHEINLHDLAYTLQIGRDCHPHRVAAVVESVDELKLKIGQFLAGNNDALIRPKDELGVENCLPENPGQEKAGRSAEFDLDEIARAWVCGATLDLSQFYPNKKPKKIALPGYSFARTRCWFKKPIPAVVEAGVRHLPERENTPVMSESSSSDTIKSTSESESETTKICLDPIASFAATYSPPGPNGQDIGLLNIAEPKERTELKQVGDLLRAKLEAVLCYNGNIDPDQPFAELGMDSVIGVEFIQILNREFDLELGASVLYDHPTANELSREIAKELSDSDIKSPGTETVNQEPVQKIVLTPLEDFADQASTHVPSPVSSQVPSSVISQTPALNRESPVTPVARLDISANNDVLNGVEKTLRDILLFEGKFDRSKPFVDMGMDSVLGVEFIALINKRFKTEIQATQLYDNSSIDSFCKLIGGAIGDNQQHGQQLSQQNADSPEQEPNDDCAGLSIGSSTAEVGQLPASYNGIKRRVSEVLKRCLCYDGTIPDSKSFVELGLDSVIGVEFINALNKTLGASLEVARLYDFPSVAGLSEHIASLDPVEVEQQEISRPETESSVQPAEQPVPEPTIENVRTDSLTTDDERIAIVGISGRYPKAADIGEFWNNIANGVDCVSEISDRWDVESLYVEGGVDQGEIYSKWLGQLDDIECFDPMFFSISPSEAEAMDPQHRIFLQECWRAMEDGGFTRNQLKGLKCGTYVGIMSNEYEGMIRKDEANAAQLMTGNSNSIFAARLAYLLDLKGPSIAVDTACSSSLVATHMACEALKKQEVDMAVSGGVSLYLGAENYRQMCAAGMLSPSGKCQTFDEGADGFVPGEGAGVVILKRLADAERDGDTIYGVIRASGVNQDGKTNGITAPSAASQAELIRGIYSRNNLDPGEISYVETHGTGTKLGDPIEIEALTKAFVTTENKKLGYCGLGSVKSNTGHTSAAAGVCSLTKVLMQMKHRKIAPTLHFNNLNPLIKVEGSPFYINTQLKDWDVENGASRIAAISSFGFSGTNAHLVVEEYETEKTHYESDDQAILPISARTDSELNVSLANLLNLIETGEDLNLYDIAFTLQTGRDEFNERIVFIASDMDDLKSSITQVIAGDNEFTSDNIIRGTVEDSPEEGIFAGKAGLAFIRESIRYKEFNSLASIWTQGVTIDWTQLYDGNTPARVNLPSYPFAKERYWIADFALTPSKRHSGSDHLSPLVHKNASTLYEQKFVSVFGGSEYFFEQHKVNGEKILPGTAYLEMARIAGAISTGSDINRMSSVRWLSPFLFRSNSQLATHVYVEQDKLNFAVKDKSQDDNQGNNIVYAEGILSCETLDSPSGIDINALIESSTAEQGAQYWYGQFGHLGIEYDKEFKRIEWIRTQEAGALSKLKPINDSQFVLPPELLDAALQTCMAVSSTGLTRTEVPFSVSEVNIYGNALLTEWCFVSRSSAMSSAVDSYHVQLLSSNGEVLVEFIDFVTLAVEKRDQDQLFPELVLENISAGESFPTSFQQYCYLNALKILSNLGMDEHKRYAADKLDQTLEVIPDHKKVLNEIARQLTEEGYLLLEDGHLSISKFAIDELDNFDDIAENKRLTSQHAEFSGSLKLLNECIRSFKDILRGNARATDVIFPDGSMELVSCAYRGNPQADYYNRSLCSVLKACIDDLQSKSTGLITIMEVGAGTGGTTKAIVDALQGYENIKYIYSDVSKSFLNLAESAFAHSFSQFETAIFNIESAPETQRIELQSADILIGANVVHATKNIASTVANLQSVLKPGGYLILNEIAKTEIMSTMIFGLLEGWWLYQDDEVRLQGSPGLSGENWTSVLNKAKFPSVSVYPEDSNSAQQIICARKEGSGHMSQVEIQPPLPVTDTSTESPGKIVSATVSENPKELAELLLKDIFGKILKLAPSKIGSNISFDELGIDSIIIGNLSKELSCDFEFVTTTTFFEYRTIKQLAEHLLESYPDYFAERVKPIDPEVDSVAPSVASKTDSLLIKGRKIKSPLVDTHSAQLDSVPDRQTDIAIIGISGQYPGAQNLEEFWQNLQGGVDSVTEIPKDRWNVDQYFDSKKGQSGSINCRYGGFISDVDKFDPLFFKIAPKEAAKMDPQERLFLQTSWEAIEDAGYTPAQLSSVNDKAIRTGVYVGVMYEEYQLYGAEHQASGNPITLGGSPSSIANRVSYVGNFTGPSFAVDTMCSSSLTAIHLACKDLVSGETDLAIAGGVNVSVHPNKYLVLSESTFLSGRGRCESFSAQGEGFVPAEGVGAVLLKPLSKAIEDDDQIYAVIKSSAVNHGGNANGYSVPNPNAQAEVINTAIKKANIRPEQISYIEAHGTGTSLGDPIEIAGLTKAFDLCGENGQFCRIGSVKSNIGHAESAAGIAGLTKVLLQMKHKLFVPSLHAEELNPQINFSRTPFTVQQTVEDWVVGENDKRTAGLSSFGAGGSNAHLIIQEYPQQARAENKLANADIVVLSARNKDRLSEYVQKLSWYVQNHSQIRLNDLAYTLQLGREAREERVAFVANDMAELQKLMRVYLDGQDNDSFFSGRCELNEDGLKEELELSASELERLIEENKYEEIASLWVGGADIDWTLLDCQREARKISLPTYPFDKKRYWFPEPASKDNKMQPINQLDGKKDLYEFDLSAILSPEHSADEKPMYFSPHWENIDFSRNLDRTAKTTLIFGENQPLINQFISLLGLDNGEVLVNPDLDSIPADTDCVYLLQGLDYIQEGSYQRQQKIALQEQAVFQIVKALQSKACKRIKLTALTYRTQQISNRGQVQSHGSGILGFVTSLAKEELAWKIRAIDVETISEQTARQVLDVPFLESSQIMAIRDSELYKITLVPEHNKLQIPGISKFRQGGVYVVLGGAGGLGVVTTEYLVQKYKARVYWIGRREPDARIESSIERIGKLGPAPRYIRCDAQNPSAMAVAYRQIKELEPEVNGVFHSAIVLHDMLVSRMDLDDFNRAFISKSICSDVLVNTFKSEPLDFVCFYSSIQSYVNGPGQANYSAGCTYKDSFARHIESELDIPCYTLNWGYWGEVGVVASEDYNTKMAQIGIGSISESEGMQALEILLSGNARQMSVVKVDDDKFAKHFPVISLNSTVQPEEHVSSFKTLDIPKSIGGLVAS